MVSRRFVSSALTAGTCIVAAPTMRRGAMAADDPIPVGSLHDQSGPLGVSGQPMVMSVPSTKSMRQAACSAGH